MKHLFILFFLLATAHPKLSAEGLLLETTKENLGFTHSFELRMNRGASVFKLEFYRAKEKFPDLKLRISPDQRGEVLSIRSDRRNDSAFELIARTPMVFWPPEKNVSQRKTAEKLGITPKSWQGRLLNGSVRLEQNSVKIWLEGRLLLNEIFDGRERHSLRIIPGESTDFQWTSKQDSLGNYEAVQMAYLLGSPKVEKIVHKEGIPFSISDDGNAVLFLKNAGWPEWRVDPSSFYEEYDGHTHFYLMDDGRVPFVQVPMANYKAAHILAYAEKEPNSTNMLTLRVGRKSGNTSGKQAQLHLRDFSVTVPYSPELEVITVPLEDGYIGNAEGNVIDVEITKELRLARRAPDPARFRWRPLGLPSNVRIAGITFEKSPVQMKVVPTEFGALFELPKKPAYIIELENITEEPCQIRLQATGGGATADAYIEVPAGVSLTKTLELDTNTLGHHPLRLALQDSTGANLLTYKSTFGVLPPDRREYRKEAPWGTWDFGGRHHFTPNNPNGIGEFMRKIGLRYGMFHWSTEERAKYGVVKGNEFKVGTSTKEPEKTAERYREMLGVTPDLLPDFLLFHEDAISGSHATRIPDVFNSHTAYKLNEKEEKRFKLMWQVATEAAKSMRKEFPDVKIHLGNGGHALREEFYRNGFPQELFDSGGNESGSFGRLPETQPPDGVANNASLWMDRRLLDAYGYKDKTVSQAYEVIYPGTNPGNLSLQTQANYFIRHILHSMAWGVEKVRPGSISDMGNSYYHSNWGGTGFMHSRSDFSPKPSAIALATLTRVLDGAKYKRFLDTGSDSAYLLHFTRRDGSHIFPFWSVRGQRDYTIELKNASNAMLIEGDGTISQIAVENSQISVVASATPAWLQLPSDSSILSVKLGRPTYPNSDPEGTVSLLSQLNSLEEWEIADKRNPLLEYYNPFTPRRKGDFRIEVEESAWKITPNAITHGNEAMPMYAELVSKKGIPLSGRPVEIGLWVNGNSGWGRVIFELEDASGQRWTSIGARSQGGSDWMADWLGRELSDDYTPGEIADWNTDDVFGLSRINFDDWRYIAFPLPGQYPGEGYHWPFNSQWRWDKDGIVHYPLTLKKIVVELPEKVLYLTRYEPPTRREVFLRDLVSVERSSIDSPKVSPYDYVEEAQITID